MGCKAGLAINPLTRLENALPLLHEVDLLLCMTVNPGFGGQPFIIEVLEKVRRAKAYCAQHNLNVDIEVDGGVNMITAGPAHTAGANVLVAGTALFGEPDMKAAIQELRTRATASASAG
jgi:ribulose-phosphate 3-epimerase